MVEGAIIVASIGAVLMVLELELIDWEEFLLKEFWLMLSKMAMLLCLVNLSKHSCFPSKTKCLNWSILACFDFFIPVLFNPTNEMYKHVDFTFGYHAF